MLAVMEELLEKILKDEALDIKNVLVNAGKTKDKADLNSET